MDIERNIWLFLKLALKTITTISITKDSNDTNINNLSDKTLRKLKLPCKDDHGINLIKSIKTKKTLPEKHDVIIILTGTKLLF